MRLCGIAAVWFVIGCVATRAQDNARRREHLGLVAGGRRIVNGRRRHDGLDRPAPD